MTSSYMGEEELDYEDEGDTHRTSPPSSMEEQEEEEEEEYDDLYNDVNVGFFPNSAATQWEKPKMPQDEQSTDEQQQSAAMEAALDPQLQDGSFCDRQIKDQRGSAVEIAGQDHGHGKVTQLELGMVVASGGDKTGSLRENVGVEAVVIAQAINEHEGAKWEGVMRPLNAVNNGRTAANAHPAGPVAISVGAVAGYVANNASPDTIAQNHTGKGNTQHGGNGGGNTRLFVGDLHWWTTDAELETALSEYGRVKNLKFFEERASGKCRGFCEVEFYDSSAARACKEGIGGRDFNGKPCIVTYASSYSFRQLSKTQSSATFNQGRRASLDAGGIKSSTDPSQGANTGRGHGPGSGQTEQGTPFRGRGGLGTRNMGSRSSSYGQASAGTLAGPPLQLQNIMGHGYDPTYGPALGRGGSSYGGYVPRGPVFGATALQYPTMTPGGLPGVGSHVNPAFFGHGANMNGVCMLAGVSAEGGVSWSEASMNSWNGNVHDQRIGEISYGGESGGAGYSYGGDISHERGRAGTLRERDKGKDGESGSYGERRHREEKDADWEKEMFIEKVKDRIWEEEDFERERHARIRNKPRAAGNNEQGTGSREEYGKRRRMVR